MDNYEVTRFILSNIRLPGGGYLHEPCPKVRGFESPTNMQGSQITPNNAHACVWGFQSPTP
jgi:hypothetical protein